MTPSRPWTMTQDWCDLLFAHWPMATEQIATLLPAPLIPDTFDGRAWLGIVPFHMENVRLRRLPPFPGATAFPELNVRTYVRHGDRSGVFFLSMDATSRLAIAVARRLFHLPYYLALMRVKVDGDGVDYDCERVQKGAPRAVLRARYGGEGDTFRAARGTLEHFLVERYALFTTDRKGRLLRADIDHAPWELSKGWWQVEHESMVGGIGLELPEEEPHLLFSERQRSRIWRLQRV